MSWVEFKWMSVVVFCGKGCCLGVLGGRVCFRGVYPCFGEFDLVVCCCGSDGVGVYVRL